MIRDHCLAVYGTLAPGRANHGQLAGLAGTWRPGTIRGRLVKTGWGTYLGFPAVILDAAGATIAVQIFESGDLPGHWARLDAFEGESYRRTPIDVATAAGAVAAWIYTAVDKP